MDHNGIIESVENKYKQILEEYFISVYPDSSLPSHGLDHHRRVWNYSRELFKLIPNEDKKHDNLQFVSELIIASYLHDIGMSVDRGLKHGKYSRELCQKFLSSNNLSEDDFPELLEAIENHDNKEYSGDTISSDLLKILSMADDLDALGYTGIFRYAEIYLTRGINPGKIGYLIRENAAKRFNNLASALEQFSDYFQKHKQRYIILDEFFSNYNDQLPSYHFYLNPLGYCGVIQIFANMITDKIQLSEIYSHVQANINDPVIRGFFGELEKELNNT